MKSYTINFTAIFFLLTSIAYGDLLLSVGVGQGIFGASGTPFERVVEIGYEVPFAGDFFFRPEAGYFEDLSGGGNKSSAWGGVVFGVRALTTSGLEIHVSVGPTYLQSPDTILGGHFQFNPEIGICFNDGKNCIGPAFVHLSSAGIEMPNNGRDFIMIQWRLLVL
jgi:hypothetical protein